MATSYVWQNTLQAGSAVEAASVSRPSTVRSPPRHMFFPVAVETLGPLSDEAHSLVAETDKKAALCTADARETKFLCQRISLAIQRSNALQCDVHSFRVPIITIPDIYYNTC